MMLKTLMSFDRTENVGELNECQLSIAFYRAAWNADAV